jgi:N-acetylneuraminic acid mutarotase
MSSVLASLKNIFGFLLVIVAAALLSACGGSGSGDGTTDSSGAVDTGGWIKITSPTSNSEYGLNSNNRQILLEGNSFLGDNATCQDFIIIIYCSTDLSISWKNKTTGATGTGNSSADCWLLPIPHCIVSWSASSKLALGRNEIEVEAKDTNGNYGTDHIIITLIDSIPPEVSVVEPKDSATDVSQGTSVTAIFNEPIDPMSIVADRLYLEDSDGNSVSGIIKPGADSITFTPDTNLAFSETYTATVTAGIMDEAGNASVNDTQWIFTTEDSSWFDINVNAQSRYGHTAVWTGSEMILWGGYIPSASGNTSANSSATLRSGAVYDPASDTSFLISPTNAPAGGGDHSAIWTGTEMIVWGGVYAYYSGTLVKFWQNIGGRYNPDTNSWTATSTVNAPSARYQHTAVWTGSEMIVWGGRDENNNLLATGARYNPATDTWTTMSSTNAPTARYLHSAIWTGTEMIVWGGIDNGGTLATGARYNPATDTWTVMSDSNAPLPRYKHAAIWTGSEMLVWGSGNISLASSFSNGGTITGGRYNPVTDTWVATTTLNAPVPRADFSVVWTGTEMVIWGGQRMEIVLVPNGGGLQTKTRTYLNSIGIYNPAADTWRSFPMQNIPAGRYDHSAIWTGTDMIVWGGLIDEGDLYDDTGLPTSTGGRLPFK